MTPAAEDGAHWHMPPRPVAPKLWCGTSLATHTSPGYGSNNLAQHVGDNPQVVEGNRQRLRQRLSVELGREIQGFTWLNQVHGTRVVEVTAQPQTRVPTADAFWTSAPNVALALLTADCLPLVLAAEQGGCVGLAHAGWRGLVDGVVQNLVAAMPVEPARLVAWGGPCIGPGAYEVGLDVADLVAAIPGVAPALTPGITTSKRQLDLQVLAQVLLRSVGVTQYQASPLCSHAVSELYSHRRDGGNGHTGRMATVAVLQD